MTDKQKITILEEAITQAAGNTVERNHDDIRETIGCLEAALKHVYPFLHIRIQLAPIGAGFNS